MIAQSGRWKRLALGFFVACSRMLALGTELSLHAAMPTATRANVAALIPAYFEEKHIRDVASRTRAQLDTVLVVDDGSTDKTSDEARAAAVEVVRYEKNAGKGAAIKTGLRILLDRESVEFILIL